MSQACDAHLVWYTDTCRSPRAPGLPIEQLASRHTGQSLPGGRRSPPLASSQNDTPPHTRAPTTKSVRSKERNSDCPAKRQQSPGTYHWGKIPPGCNLSPAYASKPAGAGPRHAAVPVTPGAPTADGPFLRQARQSPPARRHLPRSTGQRPNPFSSSAPASRPRDAARLTGVAKWPKTQRPPSSLPAPAQWKPGHGHGHSLQSG